MAQGDAKTTISLFGMADTLSSFNTEQDNSFMESAMSLEKRNSNRAASLTPRKIRAEELEFSTLKLQATYG